ncbi:MAG TPA: hypothetical protein QGH10_06775 [Armatimonadota bacterium]|nr:hypothetical protein [Armatimonadota bacterium]
MAAARLGYAPAGLGAASQGQAPAKRRRIIFNDDGDDVWHPAASTAEGFLSVRLKHVVGTQVDTIFYCTTQSFNYHTYDTKVGEVFLSREGPFANNNMQALLDAGTDPLRLAVEFAHANDVEAFWTLRMNDIHDAFTSALWPQWKTDNPDALLGKPADWAANPPGSQARWWAGVDFTRDDVRVRTKELIEEVARGYDIDGIDLDWMRHPIHFRETLEGRPVPPEKVELLTGLVRDVRAMLSAIGEERGRPIVLSVRVPMLLDRCLYIGTDIEAWLREGLVDMLVAGGGYIPFAMPNEELAALGREHGVPVYPCVSASGMGRRSPYGSGQLYGIAAWRATAQAAYTAGADGISLFNLFPAPGNDEGNRLARRVFAECGDPATLAGQPKLYCLDNAAHLDGCGYTNHAIDYGHCLPRSLAPGETVEVGLPIGEDPTGAATAALRVQISDVRKLDFRLNDQPIELHPAPELDEEIGLTWMAAEAKPAVLKAGMNECQVRLVEGEPADLTGVELLLTP